MTFLFIILILLLAAAFFAGLTGQLTAPGTLISILAFVGLAIVALTAVFVPEPYEDLADVGLREAGVRERIREIDEQFIFDDLAEQGLDLAGQLREALRGDDPLLSRLRGLIGDEALEEPVAEADAADEVDSDRGLFERRLYPALVDVFAGVLRVAALIASLSGLVAAVALAAASGAAKRITASRRRVDRLEARLSRLEAASRVAVDSPFDAPSQGES
jgi:hypothetical protein